MATQTVTIYGSASACVDSRTPNKVNNSETIITAYDSTVGSLHVFGYEKFVAPKSIRGKKVISITLHIYAKDYNSDWIFRSGAITKDWDPQKTTYYERPGTNSIIDAFFGGNSFAWITKELTVGPYDYFIQGKIPSFGFFVLVGEYYTSNSDHKPYVVVTVDDNNSGFSTAATSPTDGIYKNEKNGVIVQWENSFSEGKGFIEPCVQEKAVITWSYGSTTRNATVNGTATSYTIPESQLPEQGTVTWRVTVTDSGGIEHTSANATFTTTDATCYAYPQSPINEYIDGSKAVTFVWTRDIDTGTPANGADFQISRNNGISWTDLGHTTGYGDLTVAANTLPSGNVLWRVRGYNSDGVAGPWSTPAAIVVRAAPNAPTITSVTTVPRPTVTWQSEGQQAYQLQVGDWDSGIVYGTNKSAQVPYALPNGTAQVRLRIQNNFGLWSNWSTTTVTIANKPGKAITVTTRVVLGGVRLTWTTDGTYPTYAILRDGEEIATVTGKEYTDYTGIGKSGYIVRGIASDSSYTDSQRVVEILKLRSGLIAVAGVWDWLPLRCLRGRYPDVETSGEAEITYTRFSGRKLPVAELSGHYSRQHKLEFTFRTRAEMDALWEMLGKLVVYKDMWDRLYIGLLDSVETVSDWASDAVFTITEVDHGPVF